MGLLRSTVGQKFLMAVSGVALFGFVIAHMVGNLKMFQGAAKYDAYAHFLREVGAPVFGHGQLLWLFRAGLILIVVLHVTLAIRLALVSVAAREVGYKKKDDLSFSYASRTMRWGGAIVTGFVVFHLLDLTFGTLDPGFDPASPYRNVVASFSAWPVALAYVLCMVPLALHIYHGLWSMTQTLGLDPPWIQPWRRPLAAAAALIVLAGNVSMPLAVLAGAVK